LSRRDLVGPEQGAQTPSTVSARSYSAIVVTFRRPDSLREVLRGLSEQDLPPTLVVVADNDPNGSAAPVVAQLSAPFEVAYLAVGRNLGPAGGWARGVDHASRRADRGSWVAVFDDDDPISHPQVMGRLAAFAATAPADVAAIGRRGAHLRRWSATLRRVTPSASGRPADADYLASGGAPLYRWTAVDAVGFFDPELFFGFEDLELGIRLRRAGMRLLVLDLDDLEVVADTAPTRAAWREYYKVRSLTVICRRHLGGVALACTLVRALLLGAPRLVLAAHGLDLVRARWRGARDGLSGRLGPGASAPESNPPKRGAAV
jgi:GT2 family glycosyltransferase